MTRVHIVLVLDEQQRPIPYGIGNLPALLEEVEIMKRSAGEYVESVTQEGRW